jgi:hypothetical protein
VLGGGIMSTGAAALFLLSSCSSATTVAAPEEGGKDGTADVNNPEVGQDAADSGGNDAADAGDTAPDVAVEAASIGAYPLSVTVAYCLRLQQCCLVPDGQWNQNGANGCVSLVGQSGGIRGLQLHQLALGSDAGLVTYDPVAGAKCIQDVNALACGVVPVSSILTVQDDCFAALQGTLGVDAGPCTDPIECKTNEHCRMVGDAGTGICTPLIAQGQPCTDKTYSMDCSYLGNGSPALYCDPKTLTCQPPVALDAGCASNAACASEACNYPVCVDSFVFSDPGTPNGTCAFFTIADAGAGD